MDAVVINTRDIEITPFFKIIEVEDVPQSDVQGKLVMKQLEVVELHFAGQANYKPVFRTDAQAAKKGHNVITYAERFSDQYRAFKEGGAQVADGTPLHMLKDYGVTPEQISLCRSLRIYSIEALNSIQGSQARSLGMHQNKLKEAATRYLADNSKGARAFDEIEELKAEIARLKGESPITSFDEPEAPEVVDDYPSNAEIKEQIKALTGFAPKGNPSRESLIEQLKEAQA